MSDLCRAPVEGARRRRIPVAGQAEQNWLAALPAPPATPPFIQTAEYSYLPRRWARQVDVDRDWLLAVAPTVPAVPRVQSELGSVRPPRISRADDWPNLLASTLAGTVAPPPFIQVAEFYFTVPRRIRRTADDSIDWMTIETAPPVVTQDWVATRIRTARADDVQNLLLTTLALAPAGTPPFIQSFEYSYSLPRRQRQSMETERDWLLAVAPTVPAVPPVAPDVPYTRAARPQRFDQWPNLQLTTFSIVAQSASYPPFELPAARRALTQRFDDHPNLLLTTFSIVAAAPLFAPFDLPLPARARARRADDVGNLLLMTLSALPFSSVESSASRRVRPLRLDDPANLLLGTFSIVSQAVLPFASGEWPVPKVRRPYAIEASLNLTLTTLALVPQYKLRGRYIAIGQHDSRIALSVQDRRIALKVD